MEKYKIHFRESVYRKDLKKIPREYVTRIFKSIKLLADAPFHTHSAKLAGREERRIRVGVYRVLYSVDEQTMTVYIIKIAHRKTGYKK